MAKKNPNPPPPDDEDDDEEAEFTPKQREMMSNTINAAVNTILSRRLKPVEDRLGKLDTIQEAIEKMTGGGGEQKPNAPKPGEQQPVDITNHPEVVKMRKQVEALQSQRDRESAAARNATRDQKLAELATQAGVDKNRLRGVVALLRDQVAFDKDGNPIMKRTRDGFEEEIDIATGAREFFTTDEGKAYLAPASPAPRGGSGAAARTSATGVVRGQQGGNNAPARGAADAKVAKKQEAVNAMAGAIEDLIAGGNINIG